MKKRFALLTLAATLLVGTILSISSTSVRAEGPSGTVWTQDFSRSDEFDSLDSSKWGTSLWYDTSGVFAFKPNNVSVSGGIMKLAAKKESFNGKSYTAGVLKSKFQVGANSYTEIRAKMINKNANVTAALWLSDEPVPWSNPNIEIDMQESLDADGAPQRVESTLHTWPQDPDFHFVAGNKKYIASAPLDNDFHVYGLERRDGKLRFYLDGVKYWEYNASVIKEFATQPRNVIMSIEGHSGNPVDAYLPSDFEIDYVRVYSSTPVLNGGFEADGGQAPTEWLESGDTDASYAPYHRGGTHSGDYKLQHSKATTPFVVNTYQRKTGLEDGLYTLKAWVAKSSAANYNYCRMYVKDYGGAERTVDVNGSSWNQVTISNIQVTNGQIEFGFSTDYKGGANDWAVFDDVELYKQ
ncbi:glycoside hydrolase family 16 protein [Paenibacillus sp. LHD-117]|uniref:glycoside hydrolase family 16 protein n=1 Tax=Paenibacillus sp. LHD-117 TaxID=3071412 RepID=UPI0027DF729E|nr:glycoside hydrolase family 16 protein [Paenibacillus sp. LHD-117]MDQ6422992.1 glycoside hydrolase family 16 protein [Paenibacillus sp. LHD-117]